MHPLIHRFAIVHVLFGALTMIMIQRLFLSLLFLLTAMTASAEDKIRNVTVGGYINDIHHVDLRAHSYPGDIYIWFRWSEAEDAPHETFEFMNLYDPEAHIEDMGYDEPEVMETTGEFYNYIRHQGAFTTAMDLSRYPFDSHILTFVIEDAEYGTETLNYVADEEELTINDEISLPGYRIGEVKLRIVDKSYPTTFGDLNNPETGAYSRVIFEVPIRRPWQYGVFKLLLPVLIVLLCSALALYIDPTHTEGRIGLTITALLTLVAMQITTGGTLPEVGYLMLLDMIYLLSYAFILVVMGRVAYASWQDSEAEIDVARRNDHRVLWIASSAYIISLGLTTFFWLI